MILNPQTGVPMLVGHYDGVVTIYVRNYGAGNLRLANDKESLLQGVNLAPGQIVDGIPIAAAAGVQQFFWSGDLWIITDATGPVMVQAPAYTAYINRINVRTPAPADFTLPSEIDGNLSTYSIKGA